MKKRLKFLLFLATPVVSFATGCKQNNTSYAKISLDSIKKPMKFSTTLNKQAKYKEIKNEIFLQNNNFSTLKLQKFNTKYYKDESGTIDISEDFQTSGKIYVQFLVNDADPKWYKSSKLYDLYISKINIEEIKIETDFSVLIDINQKYEEIAKVVFKKDPDFSKIGLKDFDIDYYEDEAATILINENYQLPGVVYVIFKAKDDDTEFKGQMKIFSLKILKRNLNEIVSNIVFEKEFEIHTNFDNIKYNFFLEKINLLNLKLTEEDFYINYYKNLEHKKIINFDVEEPGQYYLQFIAKNSSIQWSGMSDIFVLNLTKKNLQNAKNNYIFSKKIENGKKFSDIPNKFYFDNEYFSYLGINNFNTKYFLDEKVLLEIDDKLQKTGIFYVQFIAEDTDKYYYGESKLFKINLWDFYLQYSKN